MQPSTKWRNVLLTDSGHFYDNELDKPLDVLINSLKEMLQKPFSETTVHWNERGKHVVTA